MASQIANALQSLDLIALLGPGGILAIGSCLLMGLLLVALNRSASRDNPMPF